MEVLAERGDDEVEASVTRDEKGITVRIGDVEHRFTVVKKGTGRYEVVAADGSKTTALFRGTDLLLSGQAFALKVRKAPPKVAGATRAGGGAGGATKVKPPMPGKIVKVSVSAGDHVQAGDLLVVLEAMKMQNEIVSPVEGTVKAVHIQEGETIDGKRVICEIE